ncbi:MAG TPA: BatD family protein [Bacteroidia bacterium]|nr:BatD family protein [Bacteroidia bacterium]HRH08380.1 BatD family protein [Bacteroidia bacterium]
MKLNLFSILLFVFVSQFCWAQDATLVASTSRNQVGVGEQFQITYTLKGAGSNFRAPDLHDFVVLSGPNQSSSMEIINGNMSQSISLSYIIAAQREGKFTIGPAAISSNGKQVNSKSLVIDVVKNPASQNSRNGQQAMDGDDNSDLFLRAFVDKSKVYVGEQLVVTFKIYTKVSIVQNALTKAPVFNGFWSEDIVSPNQQATLRPEVFDGVQYQAAEIKKTVIMPQRAGTLEITEMVMDVVKRVQQRSRSNSFFDQFFGGGYQDLRATVKSKPIKIEVMPLPTAGKPLDFNGAVGDFGMECRLSNTNKTLKTNDATNLYITLSGKGNLKLIDPFKLKLPPEIEGYDAKINDKISTTTSGVSGSRTFDYLLIPRHSGKYQLPPISFSYFDISKKSYVTLNSPDFTLDVEKGTANETEAGTTVITAKEDVKILGNDIRYIKTKTNLQKTGNDFFGSTKFYMLLLLPVLLFAAFLLFFKKYNNSLNDTVSRKSKKATQIARKRLALANNYLQQNNYDAFYNELFKSINGYLSDKLNLSAVELTKEKISEVLLAKGTNQEAINFLLLTLNKSEFARFAPVKSTSAMQTDYADTVSTISKIEEELK